MKKELLFLFTCSVILGLLLVKTLREGRWSPFADTQSAMAMIQSGTGRVLGPADIPSVDKIEIRRPEDILVFVKRDQGWKMQTPLDTPADDQKIQSLLDLLKHREDPASFRVPLAKEGEAQESALSLFGMGKPALGVQFSGPPGQETLWLGEQAAQEQGVYARWTEDGFVMLLDKALADMAAAPASSWREPRMFYRSGRTVQAVSLRKKGQMLDVMADGGAILRRDDGKGSAEISHAMDAAAHKALWDFLAGATCRGFWEEKSQILSKEMMLKIRVDGVRADGQAGEDSYVLEKTVTADGEQWVLTDLSTHIRYVVAPGDFARYLEDFTALMDKRWTRQDALSCGYLSITHDGARVDLRRQNGAWIYEGDKSLALDQQKIERFLAQLLSARATDFIPVRERHAGAGWEIALGEEADNPSRITVAKQGGQWTAHRKGDAFVWQWDAPGLDLQAAAEKDTWRDRTLWKGDADAVESVSLSRPDAALQLIKKEGAWRIAGPAPLRGSGDAGAIGAAIKKVFPLKAMRFLTAAEKKDLAKFKVRAKVSLGLGGKTQELWLGQKTPGGLLAKFPKQDSIFVLPEHQVAAFLGDTSAFMKVLEEDTDRDGRTDAWTLFVNGEKARRRLDTNHDGRPEISKPVGRTAPAPGENTPVPQPYAGEKIVPQGLRGA